MRRLALALAVATVTIAATGAAAEAPPRANLEIRTAAGTALPFRVEVADDDQERAQGLMFRRALAADAGMLFVFGRDLVAQMWMKNTYIPLDMLFLAADGVVVEVAQRTVPHSLEVIAAPRPVRAVLELNGGTAARLGIKPGDRVVHAAFGG